MLVDTERTLRTLFPASGRTPMSSAPAVADGSGFLSAWHRTFAGGAPLLAAAAPFPRPLRDFWGEVVATAQAPASQYDALRRLVAARGGLPRPVACLALTGTGFHGQHGRDWAAAPGNLHLSCALPCDLDQARFGASLPMLPPLAVCDAIDELSDAAGRTTRPESRAGIKWVNDVMIDGAKVAGVLTASRVVSGRVREIFMGIGLNIACRPQLPAGPFTPSVTCLKEHGPGETPALGTVLAAVLTHLQRRHASLRATGPAILAAAYRERSLVIGRRVGIWPDAATECAGAAVPPLTGRVAAVRDDLGLVLSGRQEIVRSGRLRILTDEDAALR